MSYVYTLRIYAYLVQPYMPIFLAYCSFCNYIYMSLTISLQLASMCILVCVYSFVCVHIYTHSVTHNQQAVTLPTLCDLWRIIDGLSGLEVWVAGGGIGGSCTFLDKRTIVLHLHMSVHTTHTLPPQHYATVAKMSLTDSFFDHCQPAVVSLVTLHGWHGLWTLYDD